MVKRFRLPPPLIQRERSDGPINVIEANGAIKADVREGLAKAGVLEAFVAVHRRWMPYVERKLKNVSAVSFRNDESGHDNSDRGRAVTLCQWIALLYVGKRIGTFQLTLAEEDGSRVDGTTLEMSSTMTQLGALIGQRKAESVFHKLEDITERVLSRRAR